MSRTEILDALRGAAEPLPWFHALWEGGSAAFGREDGWSDVDVGAAVDDGRVEDGFAAIESALAGLGPVASRWELFPVGHAKHMAALPLGVTATLDADARTLTIDEPALRAS